MERSTAEWPIENTSTSERKTVRWETRPFFRSSETADSISECCDDCSTGPENCRCRATTSWRSCNSRWNVRWKLRFCRLEYSQIYTPTCAGSDHQASDNRVVFGDLDDKHATETAKVLEAKYLIPWIWISRQLSICWNFIISVSMLSPLCTLGLHVYSVNFWNTATRQFHVMHSFAKWLRCILLFQAARPILYTNKRTNRQKEDTQKTNTS